MRTILTVEKTKHLFPILVASALFIVWRTLWTVCISLVDPRSRCLEFTAELLSKANLFDDGPRNDVFLQSGTGFPTTISQLLYASLIVNVLVDLPGIILSISTYAYLSRRHRPRLGKCFKCDYILTGTPTGICPECGTPIPEDQKKAIVELTR